jgi:hypothetical protein
MRNVDIKTFKRAIRLFPGKWRIRTLNTDPKCIASLYSAPDQQERSCDKNVNKLS